MVGMVVADVSPGRKGEIGHPTIDARFHYRGTGRAALLAAVGRLRPCGAGRGVKPGYHPGNPAVKLYESAGFRHAGEMWGGEGPVMALSPGI